MLDARQRANPRKGNTMTTDPEGFTKAEIEEFAREGWHFGPGLDWRQFVGKGKPRTPTSPRRRLRRLHPQTLARTRRADLHW